MNARLSTRPWARGVLVRSAALVTMLAMLLSTSAIARADAASPFAGSWRATDPGDGSEMRVSIAGPAEGPFRVTWTEDYITFCDGGPGLVWGTARLSEEDAYVLEADLRVECRTIEKSLDFGMTWTYQPSTDTLSGRDEEGRETIWSRPGLGYLIRAAKQEGSLTVMALPDDWCNFGGVIAGFTAAYGIDVNSVNPAASSAEELDAIRYARDNGPTDETPDVIDVGPGFAIEAKAEGLIAPYYVSTWDSIPGEMKDAEGYWYGDYYGVMAFASNSLYSAAPQTWQDLLDGDAPGGIVPPVALGGDPTISNMGLFSVYGAALAMSGTLDPGYVVTGIEFFADLNSVGRLHSEIGNGDTLVEGTTPVLLEWSYLALAQRDANPDANLQVVIPEAPIASHYAQAVSAYAPHPNAARLWQEYLYSDEGQLALMEGYCYPARYDDLVARDAIPEDLGERMPSIGGAEFPSIEQIAGAKEQVEHLWSCTVYGPPCE